MNCTEAIDYFKRRKTQYGLADNVQQAENCAVEALGKQIPKKPINVEKHYYKCPCCKQDLGVSDDDIFVYENPTPMYCSKCGQALDWGYTNDL